MAVSDVTDTLKDTLEAAGLTQATATLPVISVENSRDGCRNIRSNIPEIPPYHPMTQDKIERYQHSMKSVVKLEHYYIPCELEKAIADWVKHS